MYHICDRHICNIYVCYAYHYYTSSTSFTFKIQICDIYLRIIYPLYFTHNFDIYRYVPYIFFVRVIILLYMFVYHIFMTSPLWLAVGPQTLNGRLFTNFKMCVLYITRHLRLGVRWDPVNRFNLTDDFCYSN